MSMQRARGRSRRHPLRPPAATAERRLKAIIELPYRALAIERVRDVGDAVALVVAETANQAAAGDKSPIFQAPACPGVANRNIPSFHGWRPPACPSPADEPRIELA